MSGPSEHELLTVAADASPAAWVIAGVRDFAYDVGSIVPTTLGAYARVFHPAMRGEGDGAAEVRWAEVARANGRVMHPAAEWGSITGSWDYQYGRSQPGIWDYPPSTGKLPAEVAVRLAAVLARHTSTPQRCWFAVWEGFGGLASQWRSAPRFELPHRGMLLLTGPVDAAAASLGADSWTHQSASLWWPDDRAWCVGTDVDLMTTYVGASTRCVEHLRNAPDLEILAVSADQRVTWDSDTINLLPPAPH
jgi:hypothetical protein